MPADHQALRDWEEELPYQAAAVFAAARARALAAGHSLVESRNGYLYHVHPDGRECVIKQIEPSRKFRVGQKFILS